MTVWYLVVIITSGQPGHENVVFTIPQVNHAVCVRNKREELERPFVKKAFCVKGALPKP